MTHLFLEEKPMLFVEFLELYRLFATRMRKDLKDLFNDCVTYSNVTKREREKQSPRLQSRLESTVSYSPTSDFIPNDVLTKNTASHLFMLNDKQLKIYNALALASVSSSTGLIDTSRNACLTSTALKQFIITQQMEQVDDAHVLKLIQGWNSFKRVVKNSVF